MEKKVSIAVAVYNVEKYLKRCLDSLLAQTYKNFELILVDDCSNDNSLAICYEYAQNDNRIVVVEKNTHTVLSDVRNIGIEHATGEYIMFVDSDDYVCDTYVEDMVRAIEEKNVDAAWCNAINVMTDGSCIINSVNGYENRVVMGKELKELAINVATCGNRAIPHSTWRMIIRLDKLKTKFNNLLYCAQDVLFFVELCIESISTIYVLDKALYYYCYNEESITFGARNYDRYVDSIIVLESELKKIFKKNKMLDIELEKKLIYSIFFRIKAKVFGMRNLSIMETRRLMKNTLQRKDIKEIKKRKDIKLLNHKWIVYSIMVKLHLYFLIACCINISKKRKVYQKVLRGNK